MIIFTESDSSEGEEKTLETSKDASCFDLPGTASPPGDGKTNTVS